MVLWIDAPYENDKSNVYPLILYKSMLTYIFLNVSSIDFKIFT